MLRLFILGLLLSSFLFSGCALEEETYSGEGSSAEPILLSGFPIIYQGTAAAGGYSYYLYVQEEEELTFEAYSWQGIQISIFNDSAFEELQAYTEEVEYVFPSSFICPSPPCPFGIRVRGSYPNGSLYHLVIQ